MSFFKSIVVVDHVGKLDKFVCQVLGHDKWALSLSDNLHDLEESLRGTQHHLLIVNADIPGFDPDQFINRLTTLFGDRRPKVILSISNNISRTLKKGIKAGIDDYVTVPFRGTELLAKVVKQLQFFNSHEGLQAEIQRLKGLIVAEQINAHNLEVEVEEERKLKERYKEKMRIDLDQNSLMNSAVDAKQNRPKTPDNIVRLDEIRPPKFQKKLPKPPAFLENRIPAFKAPPKPPEETKSSSFISQNKLPPLVKETYLQKEHHLVNSKGIVLAIKVKGLSHLIEELDVNTSIELTEYVYRNIFEEVRQHRGKVIQTFRDTVLVIFQKSKECLVPGQAACQAAIELERRALFLSTESPLLEGIEFSMVVHGGKLSILQFENSFAGAAFSFCSAFEDAIEIVECCPKSRIFVTEAIYDEYTGFISRKNELQHQLMSGRSMGVAELTGCQRLEIEKTQIKNPVNELAIRRKARLA